MASSKQIQRSVSTDVNKALSNIGSMKPDMKGGDTELKSAVAPKKAPSFGEAFKAARASGDKNFTWGGKSYSTKMAGEGPKRSTPASTSTKKAETPTTNTRAQVEMRRTAARSQAAIREQRAENQADFRKRTQAKQGTKSNGPVNAGRSEGFLSRFGRSDTGKSFTERQQKKYGYAKGGSVDGCAIRGKTRAPMKKGK